MLQSHRSTDAALHDLSIKLARRCTSIIEPLLRQEEISECLREMYVAIREELEKTPNGETGG
jgi:hypothetical protein